MLPDSTFYDYMEVTTYIINNETERKLSSPPFHYSIIPVVQSTVYTL